MEDQILAATVAVASEFGIARLSVGDVARQAGVSRTTLYRHFPSKEALVSLAVVREASLILATAQQAADASTPGLKAVEAAFVAALHSARTHPLLHRLLRTEPEALLPLVTSHHGPVMGQVREAVLQLLALHLGSHDALRLGLATDAATRLLISYAIAEPSESPNEVGQFLAQALATMLAPTSLSAQAHTPTAEVSP